MPKIDKVQFRQILKLTFKVVKMKHVNGMKHVNKDVYYQSQFNKLYKFCEKQNLSISSSKFGFTASKNKMAFNINLNGLVNNYVPEERK